MRTIVVTAIIVCYITEHCFGSLLVPSISQSASSSCDDIHHCRTVWNIIWSCLVTIFSCIWVALHPNIPGPDDTSLKISLRRFQVMILALIVPEFVVVWAMQQWLTARGAAEMYQCTLLPYLPLILLADAIILVDRGWTQSHGFFAVMGGFMLHEGTEATRVLRPEELESLS
jgi:hypothetical protein